MARAKALGVETPLDLAVLAIPDLQSVSASLKLVQRRKFEKAIAAMQREAAAAACPSLDVDFAQFCEDSQLSPRTQAWLRDELGVGTPRDLLELTPHDVVTPDCPLSSVAKLRLSALLRRLLREHESHDSDLRASEPRTGAAPPPVAMPDHGGGIMDGMAAIRKKRALAAVPCDRCPEMKPCTNGKDALCNQIVSREIQISNAVE